jgi:alcohol dehydrogenase class IV
VEVEPTDRSMEEAAEFARAADFDGLIAVGGGSAIDTGKVVNLLTCHPAPLRDYLNRPVGRGVPVPGPLRPLIAVPTTAGTGSETTAVAVAHVVEQHVKAGISHRLLRPALGIVDPLNTLTAPPEVTAAAGVDILTHAIESYTTRPYDARPKHHPPDRPAYVGANPASDVWCEKAIEYVGRYLRRAVLNGLDLEARVHLALAANYAGIGFGNAGVHLPHALAYPIAGLVRDYAPAGYPTGHALVPHGMSVILTAPAAFRFTYATAPERHLRAAELMGVPVAALPPGERREALPQALVALMREVGLPNGLAGVGYTEGDVPALWRGRSCSRGSWRELRGPSARGSGRGPAGLDALLVSRSGDGWRLGGPAGVAADDVAAGAGVGRLAVDGEAVAGAGGLAPGPLPLQPAQAGRVLPGPQVPVSAPLRDQLAEAALLLDHEGVRVHHRERPLRLAPAPEEVADQPVPLRQLLHGVQRAYAGDPPELPELDPGQARDGALVEPHGHLEAALRGGLEEPLAVVAAPARGDHVDEGAGVEAERISGRGRHRRRSRVSRPRRPAA